MVEVPSPDPLMDHSAFGRRVHAVDDLGVDPTGTEPADGAVAQAIQEPGTLVEFPDGTFLFEGLHAQGLNTVGLTNAEGANPEIVTPDPPKSIGADPKVFFLRGRNIMVEGFTMNYLDRADRGGDSIVIITDNDLYVNDIEFKGYIFRRGVYVSVKDPNGAGLVENVSIRDGHRDGMIGPNIAVNQSHHAGTLTVRNCESWRGHSGGVFAAPVEEVGDTGPVVIDNCHFKNNNTASAFIGSTGDMVLNSTFEQTWDTDGGHVEWNRPIPLHTQGFIAPRHIQFRNEGVSEATIPIEHNTFLTDLPVDDTIVLDAPVRIRGAFSGAPHFFGNVHEHHYTESPAIQADRGARPQITLEHEHTFGTGAGGDQGAWFFIDHPVTIKNCCISMTGDGQDGIFFRDSQYEVTDTSITVPGTQIVEQELEGTTSGSVNGVFSGASCGSPSVSPGEGAVGIGTDEPYDFQPPGGGGGGGGGGGPGPGGGPNINEQHLKLALGIGAGVWAASRYFD